MPEESAHLIATAVRRIDNLELKLAAEHELTLLRAGSPSDHHFDSSEIVIQRWDQIDNQSKQCRWKRLLYILATLAILASIALHFQDAVFYRHVASFSIFDMEKSMKPVIRMMDNPSWSEEQRLIVFGDYTRPVGERKKALWERLPTDPAYFADYVGEYHSKNHSLPPNFHDVAARIDPDNGFFIYLEASDLAYGTVKQGKLSPSERKSGATPPWIINDQSKLEQALAVAATAKDKPHYENYYALSSLRKMPLLPQETRKERAGTLLLTSSGPALGFYAFRLGPAYAANASQLAASGDVESFRKLYESAGAFLKAQARAENPTLVDLMVLSANIGIISAEFSKAATTLGLTEEAARMKSIHTGWEEIKSQQRTSRESRSASPFTKRGDFIFTGQYRHLQSMLTSRASVTTEALLPGSFSDHALASRALALAMAFIFGLCLIAVALARFTFSPLVNSLGQRFVQLLCPRDYIRIICLGLGIPLLYVLSISYLTELGGRHWSLERTSWILPGAHFAALLVMMVGVSILASRWRLHLRAGCFSLASFGKSYAGWLGIIAAAASVPVIGWHINTREPQTPQVYAFAGFLIPGCLWFIILMFRFPWGSLGSRLTAATISRILMPVFSAAIILMLGLAVVFQWEEDYWFARYDFTRLGKNGNPVSAYEAQIQASLQRELQKLLALEP